MKEKESEEEGGKGLRHGWWGNGEYCTNEQRVSVSCAPHVTKFGGEIRRRFMV